MVSEGEVLSDIDLTKVNEYSARMICVAARKAALWSEVAAELARRLVVEAGSEGKSWRNELENAKAYVLLEKPRLEN